MKRAPSDPHHEIVYFLVGLEARRHVFVASLAKGAPQKVVIESKRHADLRQTLQDLVATGAGLCWSAHFPKISHSSAVLSRAA
jgi:hypothetical protein